MTPNEVTCHWISTRTFTVEVQTDSQHRIVRAAPLVRKFIGQPVGNLLNWAQQFGGLKHEKWRGPEASAQTPPKQTLRS